MEYDDQANPIQINGNCCCNVFVFYTQIALTEKSIFFADSLLWLIFDNINTLYFWLKDLWKKKYEFSKAHENEEKIKVNIENVFSMGQLNH